MCIVGVDLSVSNITGVSVLCDEEISFFSFKSTKSALLSLISFINDISPKAVIVDAPLSLPSGRTSIDDREGGHFRQCDLILHSLGIRFFPITIRGMRSLYKLGVKLSRALDVDVFEGFPGASIDMLGLKRKVIYKSLFSSFSLHPKNYPKNVDESDAGILSLTYYLFTNGLGFLMSGDDGSIVAPFPGFSPRFTSFDRFLMRFDKLRAFGWSLEKASLISIGDWVIAKPI